MYPPAVQWRARSGPAATHFCAVTTTAMFERGPAAEVLAGLAPDSVHAVVCDPPYGLAPNLDLPALMEDWMTTGEHVPQRAGLLGHDWDGAVPGPATWREVLRVLKPGGYVLAFAGARTADLTGLALRLAGFEIVDQIVWLHGTGFPKGRDYGPAVAKLVGDGPEADRWSGWTTTLKPSNEPILVARKPHKGSVAKNLVAYGAGAMNIAGCRIGDVGRFPANTVIAHLPGCDDTCDPDCAAALLDAQTGTMKARGNVNPTRSGGGGGRAAAATERSVIADHGAGDSGGGSRFFYCAKPSKAERNAGLPEGTKNPHPSVKPIELMRWLIRLVTPTGGVVLDPFCGSGTTLVAAALEGFDSIGIDRDDDGTYLPIAQARVAHAGATTTDLAAA